MGMSVLLKQYPVGLLPLSKLKKSVPAVAVIHIHWLSTLIAPILWSRNPIRQYLRLFLFLIDLTWVKLNGTRVVWTVHNLFEHESNNLEAEKRARKLLARCSNHIIVHSQSAKELVQTRYGLNISEKISVTRHGSYDGHYAIQPGRATQLATRYGLDDTVITILFFGNIRLYKGIETLIAAFQRTPRSNLRLLIVGRPFDEEIERSVRLDCSGDARISTVLEFVPERDVAAYFTLADVVAIPFERTLSSGSAVLAMTFGKAIILPTHAKVLDLVDANGAFYYESDSELTQHLENLDKAELKTMGEHNRQIAETFAWSTIGESTVQAYSI
jgi:beta-1,4-mannosyltransferase